MSTIELNSTRIEFAKQILDENNEDVLKKTLAYFRKIKKTTQHAPPCQMSIEELKEEVRQAVYELDNGLGIPHEEIEKKVASW